MATWYIYGAGGHGAETMDILHHMLHARGHTDIDTGFIDDARSGERIVGRPVVNLAETVPGSMVTIGVGEPDIRANLRKKAVDAGLELATVMSPLALVSDHASVDEGCIIAPFCSIQARAQLRQNVSVNTAAIVTHDTVLDRDCCISLQATIGGAARIGERCYVGMGAQVREQVSIGKSTIVGMGAVVTKDIPDGVVCTGNPARVARANHTGRVFT